MEFSILRNSMDSLSESIEYYRNGKKYNDERCFKFCILLLSHCAELLLKEILFKQHEILIYEDIDHVKSGNENTVGFKLALDRVQNICKIDLNRYYSYLIELAEVRNSIQHYQFSLPLERCTKIITSSFSAVEYIVTHVLNKTFDDFEDIISIEQIKYLHEDKDVHDKRKQDIAKDIKDNKLTKIGVQYQEGKYIWVPCPNCSEETLVFVESFVVCKFCGMRYDSLNDMYEQDDNCVISTQMKREIGRRKRLLQRVYECEECNNDTLIYSEVFNEWICLACGNQVCATYCSDCGDVIPDSEYNYIFAQSYIDADDFMFLCIECGNKFKDDEYSVEYEIR